MSEGREYTKGVLIIEPEDDPRISEEEVVAILPIQQHFIESYALNKDKMDLDEWLSTELKSSLPEFSSEEITEMSNGIISTMRLQEQKHTSIIEATTSGESKESWFTREVLRGTSAYTTMEQTRYLGELDRAVLGANEALHLTITNQNGVINANPNLDGFIAEQYHAQTFNMNAEATGSIYRAEVLVPEGTSYGKNSVDIVIRDTRTNQIVRKYQSKYCKDAQSTDQAFRDGDYRGQRKLVPEGQADEVSGKATDRIEAPDGTTSNSLSKARAKQMQEEAQSGKWNDLNWNEYQMKDILKGVAVNVGNAALLGAAIGAGTAVVRKLIDHEEIKLSDVAKDALKGAGDMGGKVAIASALKVAAEKEIIKAIPKGTPVSTIASVVYVGVENAKVLYKVGKGELTLREGAHQMELVTVSSVAGLAASGIAGAKLGAAIGTVCGPVGAAIGGFVGSAVGFMVGSKAGEVVCKAAQKVRAKVYEGIKDAGKRVWDSLKNAVSMRSLLFA